MPVVALGREVDLGPGHIVLDGNPAPPSPKWAQPAAVPTPSCLLWTNGQLLLSTCTNDRPKNERAVEVLHRFFTFLHNPNP